MHYSIEILAPWKKLRDLVSVFIFACQHTTMSQEPLYFTGELMQNGKYIS